MNFKLVSLENSNDQVEDEEQISQRSIHLDDQLQNYTPEKLNEELKDQIGYSNGSLVIDKTLK